MVIYEKLGGQVRTLPLQVNRDGYLLVPRLEIDLVTALAPPSDIEFNLLQLPAEKNKRTSKER